jgi:hypothetical protein
LTTDIERELRDLFHEKAGEAPVATPAAATQRVLRRGRRHQVGTVLGSTLVALVLAVGSFAGLRSLLRDADALQTGIDPSPVTEPREEMVELSGTFLDQTWTTRFSGAFADGSACIRVNVDGGGDGPLCPRPLETSLAGDQPSLHVVNTSRFALVVGSVPTEVAEILFTSDSGGNAPSQFQCQMGPAGWTDPDRKVCAIALPAQDGGIFEYLESDGGVLFEEGMGWGASEPTVVEPNPVDPVHGGTFWAVYPWVGPAGSPEADDVSAQLLAEFGIEAFAGDLACDEGSATVLGTDAQQGIAVYFETEEEATDFALRAGQLDHANPVIAQVTTFCLD